MTRYTTRRPSAIIACTVLLAGCHSSTPDESVASASASHTRFDNPPVIGAALSIEPDHVEIEGYQPWQLRQGSSAQTAAMRAIQEFTFSAEQTQPVSFSMAENASYQDETFCTDYRMSESGEYEFDFNSCVLSTSVLGGTANEPLDLINQHTNAIGVVSFQDSSLQPIYQESHFD